MANHPSHARLPYPIRNARFTLQIPYLDADGDPTDPTTPDTEISKDGGAFADCAEEVTTISGTNGVGYLTLSGAETDASIAALAAKVASGPKPTIATLHPRDLPILESGTAQAGAAGSLTLASGAPLFDITGCFVRTTGGTGGGGTGGANNQARRITAYNTSTKVATVAPNWETTPDNTTTYDVLCPEGVTPGMLKALNPASPGRTLDVSTDGDSEANVTKYNGTAGTFSGGRPEVNVSHWRGTAAVAPATAGIPRVSIDAATDLAADVVDKIVGSVSGTADSGSTTTMVDAARTETDSDYWLNAEIYWKSGPNVGRSSRVTAFDPATDTFTFAALAQAVAAGHDYVILKGSKSVNATAIAGSTAAAGSLVSNIANLDAAVSGRASAAALTTAQADLDDIQTRLPAALVAGRMSSDAVAISGATSAADALEANIGNLDATVSSRAAASTLATVAADLLLLKNAIVLREGTAQAGAASTITLDSGASATDQAYRDALVVLRSGTGAPQVRIVESYVGSSKVATVNRPWQVNPDNTSVFSVLSLPGSIADAVLDGARSSFTVGGSVGELMNWLAMLFSRVATAQAGGTSTITLDTGASASNDIYNGHKVKIQSGTGAPQSRTIVDYDGTTKVATVDEPWAVNPDNTSQFVLIPLAELSATVQQIADSVNVFKKNTAGRRIHFLMWDSNFVFQPAKIVTVTRKFDGAQTFSATTGTVFEVANGAYFFVPTAADLNGDDILFRATAQGCRDQFFGPHTKP